MERSAAAETELIRAGCAVARRSRIDELAPGKDCLVVDSTGELLDFYAVADVVFVGKSLRVGGGQNPLEAVGLEKPVIFGPQMGNFRDIVEILLQEGAARRIVEPDLLSELKLILTQAEVVSALIGGGRCVLKKNRGTLEKTVRMLLSAGPKKAPKST